MRGDFICWRHEEYGIGRWIRMKEFEEIKVLLNEMKKKLDEFERIMKELQKVKEK